MTADRCRCSHARVQHGRQVGQCFSAACGCSRFRPQPTPGRTDGGPSLREYLESKGEI